MRGHSCVTGLRDCLHLIRFLLKRKEKPPFALAPNSVTSHNTEWQTGASLNSLEVPLPDSPENTALDPEIVQGVRYFFDKIPFNQHVGMTIEHICRERVEVKVPMKPELIGNFLQGILHGGVVSSMLDVAGGAMALVAAIERTAHLPEEKRMETLSKIGTIDLRVDYLRPGKGEYFVAMARVLRTGNKVAVTRMELHNDRDDLLALGTGTYMCG